MATNDTKAVTTGSTVVVDGAYVRGKLVQCLQMVFEAILGAVDQDGVVGREKLVETLEYQRGLVLTALPSSTLFGDQQLHQLLGAIYVVAAATAPALENPDSMPTTTEKALGVVPQLEPIAPDTLRAQLQLLTRVMDNLDVQMLCKTMNGCARYFAVTSRVAAKMMDQAPPS